MAIRTLKFSELFDSKGLRNPRQWEAFAALKKFRYLLYGGAAYGGKSYWLRWCLIYLLTKWYLELKIVGIRVGLFCEDYPTLRDRQIVEMQREFPLWLGTYHKTDKEFILAPDYGSGVIALRNLDDPGKYASSQFAAIGVDEITRNKKEIFPYLRLRNRWAGITDPKFIAACNPDGIGRQWVMDLWINGIFDPNEKEKDRFKYIPATVRDNPHAPEDYKLALASLPEKLRKAYEDGSWDVFEGQFFSEFDRTVHIIKPFKIPFHWPKVLGMDYGWTAPSAVSYIAKNGTKRYRYKEIYSTRLTPYMLAEEIIQHTQKDEIRYIEALYYDPSMDITKGGEATIVKKMQDYFAFPEQRTKLLKMDTKDLPIEAQGKIDKALKNISKHDFPIKMLPAVNDRPTRAYAMRENLKVYVDQDGKRTSDFQMFENCKNGIRTIPSLIFSKTNPEDVDTKGDDHWYDADTYGFVTNDDRPKLDLKSVLAVSVEGANDLISTGSNW